ncbi:hypothetical protein ACHAXR_012323 [Thalassiosira sp. AJA248-18]
MGQSQPSTDDALPQSSSLTSSSSNKPNLVAKDSDDDLETMPLLLRIILSKADDEDDDIIIGHGDLDDEHQNSATTPKKKKSDNLRHLSLTTAIQSLSTYQILHELQILDEFRSTCTNLYQRVRALFFLYAVHRFHLPERRLGLIAEEKKKKKKKNGAVLVEEDDKVIEGSDGDNESDGKDTTVVCPKGYAALLDRRFEEAIEHFLACVRSSSSSLPISADDTIGDNVKNGQNKGGCAEGGTTTEIGHTSHAIPRRTSLISNLTFSRMDSVATDSSCSSSFYQYSRMSSLDGEHLLSSARMTNDSHVGSVKGHHHSSPEKKPSLLLPSDATSSALAKAYRSLAFQTLADQVKSSVRSHPGNEWMFQLSQVTEQPLCWSEELLLLGKTTTTTGLLPSLLERTPVRMDLSHSCWSDIFFLGMDYPEAARVINCSVDLAVMQQQQQQQDDDATPTPIPTPPIECRLQLTTANPGTIKLTSVDLKSSVLLTHVSQVFNYGADYLGLLKAGLVASGIVPLGLEKRCCEEGGDVPLRELLAVMMPGCNNNNNNNGKDNNNDYCPYGLELTTTVHNIPKGSRLAVSTNLLGSIIAVSMRATSQTSSLTGPLLESERRLVAARAILGEWLGGSGGGWQDSGGVWPGLKLIHGVKSKEGDPEYGVSRGRLLPQHKLLCGEDAPEELLTALERSLVLVHGGMAQNVGPILEMVTEKYLLREEEEWHARHRAMEILDDLLMAFRQSDVKTIARLVTENFFGPIRSVIPWATNQYTETLISRVQERFGTDFWGFWMLGGMSGGGMGFIFDPSVKSQALAELGNIMIGTKKDMEHSLPFAMDPVVFDYRVNEHGTFAELCHDSAAEEETKEATADEHENLTPGGGLDELLREQGFDMKGQEQIRADLQNGLIGLAKNRLSPKSKLTDVSGDDVFIIDEGSISKSTHQRGLEALASGSVGVVTLAAGVGSRWTQGAGVVKALHPFCCIGGKHRTFLDAHLAKNRRVSAESGTPIPHIFTTSWMTDGPISAYVESLNKEHDITPIYISRGQSIGLRMIPMRCDLKFLWEEQSHQRLDEQAEKVRDSVHSALMSWAETNGEGSDYRDNVPKQCLSPVGHWYEIPNLFLNGTLAKLLRERPQLKVLMLHNIDTIGADVDAAILGKFLETGSTLAYEVVPRCIDDMGGGLCRVDGKPRLVEGLALPSEDDELKFSYYNSLTTWIDIDKLLSKFGLTRHDILGNSEKIPHAINAFSRRLPTYVTIKEVKKRWGKGQEDVHPVAQYEKLWGDMSSVEGIECSYFGVSRQRGQQLKDPAQLDGWSRDGSAAYLDSICAW